MILRWPFTAARGALSGHDLPSIAVVDVVVDPSDVLMLPFVLLAYVYLMSQCQRPRSDSQADTATPEASTVRSR